MPESLRLHIENDTAQPGLIVSPAQVAERLEGVSDMIITERTAPPEAALPTGSFDVLLTARYLDLAALRSVNPKLRWVQLLTAGAERWLPGLPPGIALTNASGVHAEKAAQFILTACLMLNFGIPGFVTEQQARRWSPSFGGPLAGKTITLVGLGSIGAAAAAALRPFGVTLIGVSRTGTYNALVDQSLTMTELESALPGTNILVLSLPLTPLTEGCITRSMLERLPQGAGVVNIGRGAVLDSDGLAALLASGHLGGAVLDVLPVEPPPPSDPIWSCPRLIITPHCSLDDHAIYVERCLDIFCDNVVRLIQGRELRNLVDPVRGY